MKIIICDDTPAERVRYSKLVTQLAQKHGIEIELLIYESGDPMLFAFENPKFFADIIFLDINMPGLSGVDVAKKLRQQEYRNEIIFITVSKEHMLKGYDVGALHYIVKNETSVEDFEQIFIRAVESVRSKKRKTCHFKGGGEHRNIPVHQIRYFGVYKKIVTVFFGSETFDFPSTLDKLEREFEIHGFYRIQRSYLISLAHITDINYKEVTMSDGMVISIKRGMYGDLKEAMADYLGIED